MKFNIGQYVKWYEEYNDGLIKDAGYGLVIEIENRQPYGNKIKIYRNEHRDMFWLSEHCLEKIGDNNEQRNF
jgi:hypothetical protein